MSLKDRKRWDACRAAVLRRDGWTYREISAELSLPLEKVENYISLGERLVTLDEFKHFLRQ